MVKYCMLSVGEYDLKNGIAKLSVFCRTKETPYVYWWDDTKLVFGKDKVLDANKTSVKLYDTREDCEIAIKNHGCNNTFSYGVVVKEEE